MYFVFVSAPAGQVIVNPIRLNVVGVVRIIYTHIIRPTFKPVDPHELAAFTMGRARISIAYLQTNYVLKIF